MRYITSLLLSSSIEEGAHIAAPETLICLKAKAYLDLTEQKAKGERIDERNIRKHKTDIFRLAVLLPPEQKYEFPDGIKANLKAFTDAIENDLPDKAIFKQMGIGNTIPANNICMNGSPWI